MTDPRIAEAIRHLGKQCSCLGPGHTCGNCQVRDDLVAFDAERDRLARQLEAVREWAEEKSRTRGEGWDARTDRRFGKEVLSLLDPAEGGRE